MADRSPPKTPPQFTPRATSTTLDSPPLTGLRVIEFASLAPGPFAGLLLADYGATVLRVDRPHPGAHLLAPSNQSISRPTSSSSSPPPPSLPPPTPDLLTRHKSSIAVNLKSQGGVELLKSLVAHHAIDVIIDPFRPGVLEAAGLDPETVLRKINQRVIIARLTGFRRDGIYARMAGHDINYIAVSGVLSMLGRASEKPYPPANILGDFAGGGAAAFIGILLALLQRERTGQGQIVEANMVDGSAYLATMPRLARKTPIWNGPRGGNLLDGGCPYYNTYETKDGKYMAVGALEPQFFEELLRGLSIKPDELPGPREEKSVWPLLEDLFALRFRSKSQAEWMDIFNYQDACCTPVLTQDDLEEHGYSQRPMVYLKSSPARPSQDRDAWFPRLLSPGEDGERILYSWTGNWKRGRNYEVVSGGLVKISDRVDSDAIINRSKL